MPSSTCHIGTSGWNYRHWGAGRFYPQGLRQRDWLAYFAQHYSTVEINNSFYRIPAAETMAKWADTVPSGFRFALKLWRGITHYRKLINTGEFLERFFAFANALGASQRGPLLVQLPPSLGKDLPRLDAFLDELKAASGTSRWKFAVEFRNRAWLTDDVYKRMERQRVAVALADMERCPITEPNDVSLLYVRRHGPGGPYHGRYTEEHIQQDADRIKNWLAQKKMIYVFYNNDWGGHAVDNATQLIEAVRTAGVELPSGQAR